LTLTLALTLSLTLPLTLALALPLTLPLTLTLPSPRQCLSSLFQSGERLLERGLCVQLSLYLGRGVGSLLRRLRRRFYVAGLRGLGQRGQSLRQVCLAALRGSGGHLRQRLGRCLSL
jgi:hypothetical protein